MNTALQSNAALACLPLAGHAAARPGLARVAAAAAGPVQAVLRFAHGFEERRLAAQETDASTGLLNARGMARAGRRVLAQAGAGGPPASLVVLDFDDLVEVSALYGRDTTARLVALVVDALRAIAGPSGFAGRTGRARFTLLLPGMDREQAQAAVQAQLGKPSRIELEAGDTEIVLVPDILCATTPLGATGITSLYHEVVDQLARQRDLELRRQAWLRREAERHSRPGCLPPPMR